MAEPDRSHGRQIRWGLGLVALGHLVGLGVGWLGAGEVGMLALFIGVWQLLYVLPMLIVASVLRRLGLVHGILIGAGVTFLLAFVICTGYLSA